MKPSSKYSRQLCRLIYNSSHRSRHLSTLPCCRHKYRVNRHTFSFSTTPKDDTPPDSTSTTKVTTKPESRPLIHVHDEERPQLSIQLPNRWPFKRMARKPQTAPEPLNMHEMTTFSGLPASQFAPSEADALRATADRAAEKAKPKEQKQREARVKFWKRYTLILFLTPILLYIFDNRKAKKMAERRAEYISSASSSDARSIRDMAKLNNAELIDLYYWILSEECNNDINAAMTLDEFGKLFVNAVQIFKKRKEGAGEAQKDIRLSREYDEELTKKDKKRELKWLTKKYESVKENRLASKNKELQPWDINIFFTEYKLPSSNKIALTTLFVALSQITTDTYYNKAEVAFRIFTQQMQFDSEPQITYNELVRLVEDMLITGHFTTDTLITRRSYFPSQFGIRTSEEICDCVYSAAKIDKGAEGSGVIRFEQFGEALLELAEGRRLWESCFGFFLPKSYKPWVMVWYCSDRSKAEIADAKRKEQLKITREEERQKKLKKKNAKKSEGQLQMQPN